MADGHDYPIDRRTALATAGTLTLGGAGLAAISPPARADVTADGLTIPDEELSDTDGEIYSPWLRVTGEWSYQTDSAATTWRAYLILTDGAGERATIAETQGSTSGSQNSGAYTLLGRLTDAAFYDRDTFTVASEGETKSVTLRGMVIFQVRDDSGILAKATASDEATLVVRHSEPPVVLSGEGAILAQNDSGDPTPTP